VNDREAAVGERGADQVARAVLGRAAYLRGDAADCGGAPVKRLRELLVQLLRVRARPASAIVLVSTLMKSCVSHTHG